MDNDCKFIARCHKHSCASSVMIKHEIPGESFTRLICPETGCGTIVKIGFKEGTFEVDVFS